MPVFELDMQPKHVLKEHHLKSLEGYMLVIVLSNSLEVDYAGRDHESQVYKRVCRALYRRSYVGLLKGGAKELF